MRDEKEISSQIESNADKLFGKDWLSKLFYSSGYMDGIAYADNHPNWEEIVERMRKEITNDLRNDRWISVEDELPPKKDENKNYSIEVLGWYGENRIDRIYYNYANKMWLDSFFYRNPPTHWMPLPQAPLVTDLNKKDLPPLGWQEGNILVEEKGGENEND